MDSDPIQALNNYLQEIRRPENLTPLLRFKSVQVGPNHQAEHRGEYTFRGVTVGTGVGIAKNLAKRGAAVQALQYFEKNGVPSDNTSRE